MVNIKKFWIICKKTENLVKIWVHRQFRRGKPGPQWSKIFEKCEKNCRIFCRKYEECLWRDFLKIAGKYKEISKKNLNKIGGNFLKLWCWLYTLAECIWREFRARIARDETGRMRVSTLLPRAPNFGMRHEATARRDTRPFNSCITDH